MAIEDELSRAERALKDRLTNAGKIARDITNKAFKELINTIEEYGRSLDDITRDLEKQLDLYSAIKIQTQGFGRAVKDALPYLKENQDLSRKLVGIYKEENKLLDKLVRYQEDLITGELDYNQAAKAVAESKNLQFAIDLRIQDIQNEINSVTNEIKESNKEDNYELEVKQFALQNVLSYLRDGIAPSTEDIANKFQKMANEAGKVEALTGTIFSGLKNTSIGKLIDFDSVTKAMKATAAGGKSLFTILSTGAKSFGIALKSALGPIGLLLIAAEAIKKAFNFIVEASFAADKRVTEISKNLSIGKEAARGIYDNLTDLKGTLDTEYATTENLVKAFGEIATLTEFSAIANKGQLETQIVLTNQLGQSVEEAQALQGIFAVNNVEADKGLDIVYDQIAAFANQNKIVADGRQILKQIQGVSKQILLNFKGNTGELVKTVLQANKLGLSLDQVDKIAGSLLDFEQSISAELNAELLTGRQLNLEKARLFALNNDIAGLTQEIANQGITAEKFAGMNRIQQQAIAQSLGLQASELGDALYKSKLIDQVAGDTTKKLREQAKLQEQKGNLQEASRLNAQAAAIEQGIIEGKTLEQAQKSVDTQTKFNLALERAKEIFTDVIDGGLLDGLVSALEDIVIGLERLGFGTGISYNTEELVKTAQQNNLSYTSPQIEQANQTFEARSRGITSLATGNSQYSPIVSELEFLAETIDAIVPYSDVSYFNRDRQAERMLEEIKQSNEATQKAIQEQTQVIKADRQISVAVDGNNVFKAMNTSKYMS